MKKEQQRKTNIGSWRKQHGEPTPQWRNQKGREADLPKTERNETPKTIAISHYHRICKPWIILPYGVFYNKELLTARKGDILLFSDKVEREIEYLTPIKSETSFTDYLCRKTYQTGFKTLRERWKVNLEFEGYNINAIDKNRVMLIFLKEEENGKKRNRLGQL